MTENELGKLIGWAIAHLVVVVPILWSVFRKA